MMNVWISGLKYVYRLYGFSFDCNTFERIHSATMNNPISYNLLQGFKFILAILEYIFRLWW